MHRKTRSISFNSNQFATVKKLPKAKKSLNQSTSASFKISKLRFGSANVDKTAKQLINLTKHFIDKGKAFREKVDKIKKKKLLIKFLEDPTEHSTTNQYAKISTKTPKSIHFTKEARKSLVADKIKQFSNFLKDAEKCTKRTRQRVKSTFGKMVGRFNNVLVERSKSLQRLNQIEGEALKRSKMQRTVVAKLRKIEKKCGKLCEENELLREMTEENAKNLATLKSLIKETSPKIIKRIDFGVCSNDNEVYGNYSFS